MAQSDQRRRGGAFEGKKKRGKLQATTSVYRLTAFPRIVGNSAAIQEVMRQADMLGPIDGASPYVTGKSGTGKDLIARYLHLKSPRGRGPFVAVNCGSITERLTESEYFGHVLGAFTGADRAKLGLFRQANGGTLFLDEVAEMTLHQQVVLLRAVEDKIITPVGGDEPKLSA